MVLVLDMLAGRWLDEEGENEGPGRGGCRRPRAVCGEQRRPVPRLELRLVPVAAADGRDPERR